MRSHRADWIVEKPSPRLLRKLRAIADYQFFPGAGGALIQNNAKVLISRNTGRVRAIIGEEGIIATIRASDYRFLLRFPGGLALHRVSMFPKMRVVVIDDVAGEIRRGGNLFARHVLYVDEDLRPWDEVLIVDESDRLCGVGRLLLSPREVLYFIKGVAAITREGEWWRGEGKE
jgi:archaeosine-15-forming tRNA-guanine transglycosylase